MKRTLSIAGVGFAGLAVLLVGGCSTASPAPPARDVPESAAASPSAPAPGELDSVPLPVPEDADVDGVVEVAGHDLAVHCLGAGSPTVVLLHGGIDEPGLSAYDLNARLIGELSPDFRACTYDRANVGESQTVHGTQTPEMVVGDLDGLMEALGDHGPYLLVGESQGGMVASAYAVAHPEKVAGIVMVDAAFDEEITIEDVGMVPDGASPCDPANRTADGEQSLQKIDNCAIYKWAYERRDQRPRVPLVYLAAQRTSWKDDTTFGPDWSAAIVPLMQSYAASWSPGKFEWVDSGHDIPSDAVGNAVRWVVDQRSQ